MRINSQTVRFKTTLRHISDFHGFPEAPLPCVRAQGGTCSGDWDIVIHLNTTGPSTSTADIKGGLGTKRGTKWSTYVKIAAVCIFESTWHYMWHICDISYFHGGWTSIIITVCCSPWSDRVSTKTTTGGEVKPGQPWWIRDVRSSQTSPVVSPVKTKDNQGHNQPQFSIISEYEMTGETEIWCPSAGATDINTKLTPEVSSLNKGAAMPWP